MRVSSPLVRTAGLLLLLPVAVGCTAKGNETKAVSGTQSAASTMPAAPTAPGMDGSAPATPRPETTEIAVEVASGKVTPKPATHKVVAGRPVRIVVIGDKADELHIHGYDKSATLEPGKPAVVEFDATMTGRFEVELHKQELQLFSLQVQ